jgi:excisionase family DNA binding protein
MTNLLTMDEVAERTRASVDTLRYWRHKGTGPKSFKLGRRVVYREDDLEEWIGNLARSQGAA